MIRGEEVKGGGQQKGKVGEKNRAISTLINTHLDGVGTSPAYL